MFSGVLAVVGILMIYNTSPEGWLGIFITIFASALSAIFTLLNGKLIIRKPPSIITFYEMLVVTAYISFCLFFTAGFNDGF